MAFCENCNTEITQNYCPNCGPSTSLQRIDRKYIWSEISSVLNLDKGIFYTIKELCIRPGKAVREFLFDDRNRLVKPIIFIVITSLVYSMINHYFQIEEQYIPQNNFKKSTVGKLMIWIQENYGYANILMGVFIASFIKLFFKKYQYNFYEILILLCFVMGIGMLIFSFFSLFQGVFHVELFQIGGLVAFFYTSFAIADFYDKSKVKNYFKSFIAYILGVILFIITVVFIGLLIDLIIKL
ncbi:DUF3667 domain-containing protein [Weeksellaceae bacterium TAE3-ERU29]|nr:DUF3667 domain-containing protein [Weeksellaceae bacterium TAE3-ERU29]